MPPFTYIKIAAVFLFASACSYSGWKLRDLAADAQIAGIERQIAKAETAALRHAVDLSEANRAQEQALILAGNEVDRLTAEAQKKNEVQIKTVVKEVIRYAQTPDRPVVTLPADWVRIHNLAATGREAPNTTAPARHLDAGTTSIAGDTRRPGQ